MHHSLSVRLGERLASWVILCPLVILLTLCIVSCGGSKSGSSLRLGESCSNDGQQECEDGTFCKLPDGECQISATRSGVCTEISQVCIELYAPVCGCDQKTYSNGCYANGAGVSVLRTGAC